MKHWSLSHRLSYCYESWLEGHTIIECSQIRSVCIVLSVLSSLLHTYSGVAPKNELLIDNFTRQLKTFLFAQYWRWHPSALETVASVCSINLLFTLRLHVAGLSTWNSLPGSLRDQQLSDSTFRRQLKTYFLAKYQHQDVSSALEIFWVVAI